MLHRSMKKLSKKDAPAKKLFAVGAVSAIEPDGEPAWTEPSERWLKEATEHDANKSVLAKEYLRAHDIQTHISTAIHRVLAERPADPKAAIASYLTESATELSVNYDAVVYGAGPVGAAIALGLQQLGHRVCVREKRTENQVVIDAGKSINLSLSTRGRALLTEIGAHGILESTLVPMVSRRFANGSVERYREPLLSINRNMLTIKLIKAAEAAGVKFEYGTGYTKGDVDVTTGIVCLGAGRRCKPRVIIGCDGVHGKLCKLINPSEPERSSRASEWGYYELSIPPEATTSKSKDVFENFHIWPGRGSGKGHFIVGLPNEDGSITLTLFALLSDMGAMGFSGGGAAEFRKYLGEAYEGGLDSLVQGVEEALAGGFVRIWLNDHEQLAGELGTSGTFLFLFGDSALGMEQFLGLAVNLGFEGAHRGFFEHWARPGEKDVGFWRGLVRARNHLNAGAKALQLASSKNAASMRDGCDDPLGKAVRAVMEATYGKPDIDQSAFESTHDWWSFCTVPLKVIEAVVDAQDELVRTIKQDIKAERGGGEEAYEGALSEAEKEKVLSLAAEGVPRLVALRAQLTQEYQAAMQACFA